MILIQNLTKERLKIIKTKIIKNTSFYLGKQCLWLSINEISLIIPTENFAQFLLVGKFPKPLKKRRSVLFLSRFASAERQNHLLKSFF